MKNNAFTVLVVLSGLTLAPGLQSASGARKANSQARTSSFSMAMLSMQAQSSEYKELEAIAAQAFEQLSPATKQWFAATAKEYVSKQPVGGTFDVVWAAKTIQTKFSSGMGGQVTDGMLAVLMNSLVKEALRLKKDDQHFARWMKEEALRARTARLDEQIKTIEQGQREARERYDRAMEAAEREMWIGLMSALCSTLHTGIGSLSNGKQPPAKVDDKNLQQAVIRKLRAQLATLRASGL